MKNRLAITIMNIARKISIFQISNSIWANQPSLKDSIACITRTITTLQALKFIGLGQFVENELDRDIHQEGKNNIISRGPYNTTNKSGNENRKTNPCTQLAYKLFFSGLGAFLQDSSFHMIFSSFRWMKYYKNIVSTFCLFVKKVAHLIDITDFSFVLRNILPGFVFKHACSNNPKQNITHQNSQYDMHKKENNTKEQSHQEPNTKDGDRQNKSLHEGCCGVYLLLPIKVFHCFPQHIDAQRVIS